MQTASLGAAWRSAAQVIEDPFTVLQLSAVLPSHYAAVRTMRAPCTLAVLLLLACASSSADALGEDSLGRRSLKQGPKPPPK